MTDKEIIKALEDIRYHLTASKHKQIVDDAIETINRQQKRIEFAKNLNDWQMEELLMAYVDNERLKRLLLEEEEKYIMCAKRFYKEAIKEFAERLNKEAEKVGIDPEGDFVETDNKLFDTVANWCKETSDNLVKEMVGEE